MSQRDPAPNSHRAEAGFTRGLARWISGLRSAHLPDETRRIVRLAILDTLGAALWGRDQAWSRAAAGRAGQAIPAADLVALLADRGGRTRAGGAPLGTPDSAQLEGETGERSLA